MKFRKGGVTVEHRGAEVVVIVRDEWPRGIAFDNDDADDALAVLQVSHLARQHVNEEALRVGAEAQGVTVVK